MSEPNTLDVWVLVGHFKRKPSELLGVYEHYDRGKDFLDGYGFIGVHNEVELKRVTLDRHKSIFQKKKAQKAKRAKK